jgi:hypothetical protein
VPPFYFAKDGVFVAFSPTSTRDESRVVRNLYADQMGEYHFTRFKYILLSSFYETASITILLPILSESDNKSMRAYPGTRARMCKFQSCEAFI